MTEKAVGIFVNELSKKNNLVLGLPTGKTPIGFYSKISSLSKKNIINLEKVKTFNLDEYYPIKRSDKRSFYHFMSKNLYSNTNLKPSNINIPNGEVKDYKKECLNYESKLKSFPIDLEFLGIGINGHIAFNEPGSTKDSKTRLIDLTKETIKKNSNIFNRRTFPKKGLTMGISSILSAKKIILMASGKHKAKAVECMLNGPISKSCPASFLRDHKDVTIIIDKSASSLL